MKNGTRSSNIGLADNNVEPAMTPAADVAKAPEDASAKDGGGCDNPLSDLLHNKVLFAVVSIACFTAAVAAGSYAVWLSRRKVAHEALTHVSDLLETCQSRMTQMEQDLSSLSQMQSTSG